MKTSRDLEMIDPAAVYDTLAPCYAAISRTRNRYLKAIERIIIAQTTGSDSLLDIGAGDGIRTLRIAEAAGIPCVRALEPSENMRARWPHSLLGWGCKATQIPVTQRRFDVILCLWNVLGHLKDRGERISALAQARELLSPNGMMFVDVNHRYNAAEYGWPGTLLRMAHDRLRWSETNGDVIVRWKVDGNLVRCHGHLFTSPEIENIFRETALRITNRWTVNYTDGTERRSCYEGHLLFQLSANQQSHIDESVR
jgi:2-polyprenyl-3-methyl-5-hydroxy-6-metoxy-1,4-benzoquinol methylase